MKAFRYISVLCVLLLSGSVSSQVVFVDQPKVCYECHGDFEDYMKKKDVHVPFEEGTCSECHNPHASKHASLLGEEVLPLCSSCHESIKEATQKTSVHMPVTQGECTACHDPHASNNASLMMAEPSALCASCHTAVSEWKENKVVHAPVEGGECLSCHGPHGEMNNDLLKESVPKVCYECHDSKTDIKTAHKGYDITNANCIACHDPHSSSIAKLLRPNQHAPFKAGNCTTCHEASAENAFAIKTTNKKLCLKCHKSVVDNDLAYHHNLDDDKSCMNCHNPHASAGEHLLKDTQPNLCMSCHFNDKDSKLKPKEEYITHDGIDCANCHLPHGANNPRMLKEEMGIDLCVNCHTGSHSASHPLGEKVIDPRNNKPVTCLSCHQLHGADYRKYLPLNPAMDLCLQCHKR